MAELAEFGLKKDIADDPLIIAQRYLNIYRQLHIFTPEKKEEFHKELQSLSVDVKRSLTSIPGGVLLQEYMDETFGGNTVDEFKGEKVSIKDLHHSEESSRAHHVAVPSAPSNVIIDDSFAKTIASAIKESQLELAKMFAEHKQEVVIQQAAGAEGYAPIAPTVVIDEKFGNNVAAAILASQSELLKTLKENKPEIIVQQPANQEGLAPVAPTVVIDDAFGDSIAAAIVESQSELLKVFASIKPEVVIQQPASDGAAQVTFDDTIGTTIASAIKESQKELINTITSVSKENTEMLKKLLEKTQTPIVVQDNQFVKENNKKDKNKNNQNQNNNAKNKEAQNKSEQKDFGKNNNQEPKVFDKPKENNNQHSKKEKIVIEQKKEKPKFEKPKKSLIDWSEMASNNAQPIIDENIEIDDFPTFDIDEELSKSETEDFILKDVKLIDETIIEDDQKPLTNNLDDILEVHDDFVTPGVNTKDLDDAIIQTIEEDTQPLIQEVVAEPESDVVLTPEIIEMPTVEADIISDYELEAIPDVDAIKEDVIEPIFEGNQSEEIVEEPVIISAQNPQEEVKWGHVESDNQELSDDDYEWEYVEDDGTLVEGEDYEWEYVDEDDVPPSAK